MATTVLNKVNSSEWLFALPRLAVLAVKLAFDRDVSWETKVALGGGMLYIISPIDGIPDFIPVFGQLEDILIGLMLIDGMVNHIDRSIVLRHWTGQPETLDAIGNTTRRITALMPKFLRERVMKKAFRNNWKPEPSSDTRFFGKKVVDAG